MGEIPSQSPEQEHSPLPWDVIRKRYVDFVGQHQHTLERNIDLSFEIIGESGSPLLVTLGRFMTDRGSAEWEIHIGDKEDPRLYLNAELDSGRVIYTLTRKIDDGEPHADLQVEDFISHCLESFEQSGYYPESISASWGEPDLTTYFEEIRAYTKAGFTQIDTREIESTNDPNSTFVAFFTRPTKQDLPAGNP